MQLGSEHVPAPDHAAEPEGFVVLVGGGDRIHFLDWTMNRDVQDDPRPATGILLVHGLAQTAWTWASVARRLGSVTPVVAMDLRGHGLSDAPTEGFDPGTFAEDVTAAAEGGRLLASPGDRVVLAGHGFGAIVAAWAAATLGERCAALVLVDGGWEDLETSTGLDAEAFLRDLDEPPEVLRSMAAYLEDRIAFDPTSWDEDQERAARGTVVETHAGRVVPVTRPHVVEGCVHAMFGYEPEVLAAVTSPIVAVLATDDDAGSRRAALEDASRGRQHAGRDPITVVPLPALGHNVMRYRPDDVAAILLAVSRASPDSGPAEEGR